MSESGYNFEMLEVERNNPKHGDILFNTDDDILGVYCGKCDRLVQIFPVATVDYKQRDYGLVYYCPGECDQSFVMTEEQLSALEEEFYQSS